MRQTIVPSDLLSTGSFTAIVQTDWGFTVAAYDSDLEPPTVMLNAVVEADGTLRFEAPVQIQHRGAALGFGDGRVFAAEMDYFEWGRGHVTELEHDGTQLVVLDERIIDGLQNPDNVVVADGRIVWTNFSGGIDGLGVVMEPLIPGDPAITAPTTGINGFPLVVPEGVLIPGFEVPINGCDACLELFDPVAGQITYLSDTPCQWIHWKQSDGAFQAQLYEGELFVANGHSGVLRMPWTPDALVVPQQTTLTAAIWPDRPEMIKRVERIDDLLVLYDDWNPLLGLVRICEP